VLDLIAVNFRQTIDRLGQQLGRGMVVGVKILVNLRAPEPKIGAEINDHATGLQQRDGKLGGNAVRQRKKHNVGLLGEQVGVGVSEAQRLGARWLANRGKICARVWPAF